VSAVLTPLCH